jgi:hypothetical protein
MSLRLAALSILLLGSAVGCKPTFEIKTGALEVAGKPFAPSACHVLTCPGGIELLDSVGARLELALPPARLDAWRDIGGVARVRLAPAGEPETDLGSCGSAILTGEGYHGEGRRAASGKVSLECHGPPTAQGVLAFTGCF